MISHEDCLAMCGLNEREVAAIAEHECVPEITAAALASHLLHTVEGEKIVRQMLVEDIQDAFDQNRVEHATELFLTLRRFLDDHPRAAEDLVPY